MKIILRCGALIAAVLLLSISGTEASQATTASILYGDSVKYVPIPAGENCAFLWDRGIADGTQSKLVARACGNTPRIALRSAFPDASATLLQELYRDNNYGGPEIDNLGYEGGCDPSGYTIWDFTTALGAEWHDALSSFKVFNGCYRTVIYKNEYEEGASKIYYGDNWYMGPDPQWNDCADSLHVSS